MADDHTQVENDRRAYRQTFATPAGGHVLVDLADFCRANESCAHLTVDGLLDRDRTLMLEGRREVFLRIQQRLHLTTEQLAQLYVRVPIIPGADNG